MDEKGVFLGKIFIFDVVAASDRTAAQLADSECLKLYADQSINQAMEAAIDFVGEGLPVLDKAGHQMVGVVSESHLFDAYNSVTRQVREIETA